MAQTSVCHGGDMGAICEGPLGCLVEAHWRTGITVVEQGHLMAVGLHHRVERIGRLMRLLGMLLPYL